MNDVTKARAHRVDLRPRVHSRSGWVCRWCGCAAGYWFHGWKHQRNWRSPHPSCGR